MASTPSQRAWECLPSYRQDAQGQQVTHQGSTARGGRAGAEPDCTGLQGGQEFLLANTEHLARVPPHNHPEARPHFTHEQTEPLKLCSFAGLTGRSQDKTPGSLPGLEGLPLSRGGPCPEEGPESCSWKESSWAVWVTAPSVTWDGWHRTPGPSPRRHPVRLGSATALLKRPRPAVHPWPGASSLPAQAPASPPTISQVQK